ncbi:MAG: tRNA (cytidine(34)-2'-O)-methyltransferase [Cellvibrionales bacterium]
MDLQVVLYEPEIPPNTGNIIRLCANTGVNLHLIEPLGFSLDDKRLLRAGLDYHEFAAIMAWPDLAAYLSEQAPRRLIAIETSGSTDHAEFVFQPGDALLFGPETRGLPPGVLAAYPDMPVIRLPMLPHSRSLNLANAVSVVVYEAWRQWGFTGSAPP